MIQYGIAIRYVPGGYNNIIIRKLLNFSHELRQAIATTGGSYVLSMPAQPQTLSSGLMPIHDNRHNFQRGGGPQVSTLVHV